MKQFPFILAALSIVTTVFSSQNADAQCIDSTLINPNAICPLIWDPVCGCDGVTYGNSCQATNYGGVISWTPGECAGVQECQDLGGVDFGLCEMALGVALVNGSCTFVSGCGYVVGNIDYSPAFHESMEECLSTCLGIGDCIDPSLINPDAVCPAVWNPVCGCDGVTYANDCEAINFGGVTSWTLGECQGITPCMDLAGIDFGPCDMVLGVAVVNGQCTWVSGCGTTVNGIDYAPAFSESMEACEALCMNQDCIDPSLIDPNVFCTGEWDPVCGCDGVTYSNACVATYHYGVTSFTPGECGQGPVDCFDVALINFGDCDMPLGYALVNGTCEMLSGCGYVVGGIDFSPYFYEFIDDCISYCGNNITTCVDTLQMAPDYPCIEIFEPVCGCDNVTYENSCNAFYYGGVTSWTPGECVNQVGDLISLNGVNVYPNPVQDMLTFTSEKQITGNYYLLDATGRTVINGKMRGATLVNVDVSMLSGGIYFLRVSADGHQPANFRLVK